MFNFLRIIFQALFSTDHQAWYTVADVKHAMHNKWIRNMCGLKNWQIACLQKMGLHVHTVKTTDVGYREWEEDTIMIICKEGAIKTNDRVQLDIIQHHPTIAVGIKL